VDDKTPLVQEILLGSFFYSLMSSPSNTALLYRPRAQIGKMFLTEREKNEL
jgi:hypothetical protein